MSHPQKDHLQGLLDVFDRYKVDYFLRSDVSASSQGYISLQKKVAEKHVSVKYISKGETIAIQNVVLSSLWPDAFQIAKGKKCCGKSHKCLSCRSWSCYRGSK
jgi:beta-lactamase superfamily II metal-dependent hydrolase